MSVRAHEAVRDHSRMKGAARNVLNALADRAGEDGVAWPSSPKIADEANVHPRTVRRLVAKLVAAGELEVRRAREGERLAYRLLLPGLELPRSGRPPWELAEPWSPDAPGQVVPLGRGQRVPSTRAGSSSRTVKGSEPSGRRTTKRGGMTDERFSEYDA